MRYRSLGETHEHVPSYYAATAPDLPTYAPLDTQLEADVCVVGGGFSGVSTALHLAERGLRVVLLEAHRIGWGASGRNGGQLIGGFSMEPQALLAQVGEDGATELWRMGIEAVEIVRERIARYAIDCDFQSGYCDVAIKPRHLDRFDAFLREEHMRGTPYAMRRVGREELRTLIRSDRYIGGLIHEGYGHLHPLKLCAGEARAAAALGASVHESSAVLRIEHGAEQRVWTSQGSVRCKDLVLCCDTYLGRLVPSLAAKNLPAASFVIATEPLGARAAEVMTRALAVCDTRWALDYFRLSKDGRLLFGGACNYSGRVPRDIAATMRRQMLRVFPQLADVRIDHAWGGMVGISMNRVPQLGEWRPHVWFAQGYSGHGVGPSHLMGRLIAEAIQGERRRFELFARVRHRSFPGGPALRQPLYALGMLYCRLLDAL